MHVTIDVDYADTVSLWSTTFFSENGGVVNNNYADTRFSRIYLRHFFASSYLTQIKKYRKFLILLNNYIDPGGAKLDLFRPAE